MQDVEVNLFVAVVLSSLSVVSFYLMMDDSKPFGVAPRVALGLMSFMLCAGAGFSIGLGF